MGDEEEAPVVGEEEAAAEETPVSTDEKRASKSGSNAPSSGSRKSVVAAETERRGSTYSIICVDDIINLQILTAVITGEILNFCWYSDFFPWGSWHTRSFTSALASDLVIAIILGLITSAYVPVTNHLTSANLSLALSLLYMALEGTHTVWYPRNLAVFALHGLHKLLLLFAMSTSMMYVRSVAQSEEFPDVNCFGGSGDDGEVAAEAPAEEDEEAESGAVAGEEAPAEEAQGEEEAPAEGEEAAEGGEEGEEEPADE